MPQLSTGFVIAGAYADKVRRVLFAQLRDKIKAGEIDNKTVAMRAGELNRLLFEIIVNKLKLDKGDVVRIRIEYELKDRDVEWKLNTLRIEAFRRIPDEEVEKIIKEAIGRREEILAREVTEEERAWTEAREREVERELKRAREQRAAAAQSRLVTLKDLEVDVAEAAYSGSTLNNEYLFILTAPDGENIGLAIAEPMDGATRATIILIPGRKKAYKATITVDEEPERLQDNPTPLIEAAKKARYTEIGREDAEKIIREKLAELT